MTIKKSDRITKEKEFYKVNNDPDSTCSGVHYIANQKKYEECKKCKICPKYIQYKRLNEKGSGDVKFHYVDSFRECELYKKDFSKPITLKREPHSKEDVFKNPLIQFKDKNTIAAEAYVRLNEKKPGLINFLTWSESFAIACMQYYVERMNLIIRKSGFFKGKIKHNYNIFWNHYILYRANVRDLCYVKGDDIVMKRFADGLGGHFMRFQISIENYLNKFKIKHSSDMSCLLVILELISFVKDIHNETLFNLKSHDKDAYLSEKLRPDSLLNEFYLLISLVSETYFPGVDIHINDDINVVNGIKVIKNKVRNPEIIKEIIYQVDEYHKSFNKSKK